MERRSSVRARLNRVVQLTRTRRSHPVAVVGADISEGGLMIEDCPDALSLSVGERIRCRLPALTGRAVRVSCRVVWREQDRAGLAFEDITEVRANTVREMIASLRARPDAISGGFFDTGSWGTDALFGLDDDVSQVGAMQSRSEMPLWFLALVIAGVVAVITMLTGLMVG